MRSPRSWASAPPADIRPVGSDPIGGVFTTHPLGTTGP